MAEKRRALEARQTALLDRIAEIRSGKQSAITTGQGVFRATRLTTEVLDVARATRTSLQPGVIVCSTSVNAARFEGQQRVVFCSTEDLKRLLTDGAIEPTH